MIIRIAVTAAILVAWSWMNFLRRAVEPLVTGPLAVKQFDNSDISYLEFYAGTHLFSWLGLITTVTMFTVLYLLWRPALRKLIAPAVSVFVLCVVGLPAFAYYDKTNYTEVYFILPNESAFFIPDAGANKDTQGGFGSEAYLRENKIAAKRFEVPHQKLVNTGFWSDFYVPTGRLIIVDRTPYSREWVDAHDRGTSVRKQGFPCQSKEGLDITVGMSIGASVFEENSPRFLYRFGVKPPSGDRKDPNVIFTSVFYGANLQEVMDSVVRNKVQTLVCGEIGARTFNEANQQATEVQAASEKKIKAYMEGVGISLDFIGWADTFSFSPDVQKAINDRYIADTIQPVLATLQAQADIKVKEGLGDGLRQHGLPASLIAIPTNLIDGLASFLQPKTKP